MKFFAILLASLLVASQAAIQRPDQALADIEAAEDEVASYQSALQAKIRDIRAGGATVSAEFIANANLVIKSNIKTISVSDNEVRTALAAVAPSACIKSLESFTDDIIELSGYATSNCIEVKSGNGTENIVGDSVDLDKFEQEVNSLGLIPINAFIGRNIFTNGTEIVAKITNELAAKKVEFDATLEHLLAQSGGASNELQAEIEKLKSCFVDINESVTSAISAVQAQIQVCVKFSGRGGRAIFPLKASNFFPQLD